MSKKQLYIHIGTHKTGTTAIQRFLLANTDELLKQKVLYPKFSRERCEQPHAHYHLIIHHSTELDEPILKEFNDEEVTVLKQEFDHEVEQSGAKKIILSCEDFFYPLSVQQWKLLRILCEGYESFVIAYFRCQDEFLISFYNQKAKHSSNIRTPLSNILEKPKNFVEQSLKELLNNYENVLSTWSDIVGDDHVIVVPYEGNVKRDVIGHFLKSVGIEDSIAMTRSGNRENISIPYTFIKLKRLMNNAAEEGPLPYQAYDFMRLAKRLNMLRANDGRKASNPSPLSPQKRREIIAQYEKVNQRIAQKYLGKEKLFEAPLPCDDELFDETVTLSREEYGDVLAVLVADYMETRRTLNALEKSYHELHNRCQPIAWLRIFNARVILSFLKRKLFSAAARFKKRTVLL